MVRYDDRLFLNASSVGTIYVEQARFIAQLVTLGAQLVGRAFTQALKEEFRGEQQNSGRLF